MSRRLLTLAALIVAATQVACVGMIPPPGFGTLSKRALAELEALSPEQRYAAEGKRLAFKGTVISSQAGPAGQVIQIMTKDWYATAVESYGPTLVGLYPRRTTKPIAVRGDFQVVSVLGNIRSSMISILPSRAAAAS
jgi:hypothetical protein